MAGTGDGDKSAEIAGGSGLGVGTPDLSIEELGGGALGGEVDSFNGRQGVVVPLQADYDSFFATDAGLAAVDTRLTTAEGYLPSAPLTQGSVLFVGSDGRIKEDNPNWFWDDTNNRLHVGPRATFPGSQSGTINFYDNKTDADRVGNYLSTVVITPTYTFGTPATGPNFGIRLTPLTIAGNADPSSTYVADFHSQWVNTSGLGSVIACTGQVEVMAAATAGLSTAIGVHGIAQTNAGAGPLAVLTAVEGEVSIDSTGTISDTYGYHLRMRSKAGSVGGTVTRSTGAFIDNQLAHPTVGTAYGLRVSVGGAATNYGIYSESTAATNYFAGAVTVGVVEPSVGRKVDIQAPLAIAQLKSTTGTNAVYHELRNGSGIAFFGIENSGGNGIIGGGTAYATVITNNSSTQDLILATNATGRLLISGSGNTWTVPNPGSVVAFALPTINGVQWGSATGQKQAWWGATPVNQPTAVADATDAATAITQLNALLARVRAVGLIAA